MDADSCAPEPTPTALAPDSDGHTVIATMPTNVQWAIMHEEKPRHRNPRISSATDFRWITDRNVEIKDTRQHPLYPQSRGPGVVPARSTRSIVVSTHISPLAVCGISAPHRSRSRGYGAFDSAQHSS